MNAAYIFSYSKLLPFQANYYKCACSQPWQVVQSPSAFTVLCVENHCDCNRNDLSLSEPVHALLDKMLLSDCMGYNFQVLHIPLKQLSAQFIVKWNEKESFSLNKLSRDIFLMICMLSLILRDLKILKFNI